MKKIISYTYYRMRETHTKERGKIMYRELVDDLRNNPANKFSINDAEKLAEKVLAIKGHEIGVTPIIEIAKNFGFKTFIERNMPEDISGNLFVGGTTKNVYGTDKVIVVGDQEEYAHQRFIVAHELAHYLMDYLGSDDSKNSGILFSKTYPKNNHHSIEEIRADRFAAELLMPTKLFYRQYLKAMEASDYNIRYTIAYLSNYFKTKKTSIERRIEEVIH